MPKEYKIQNFESDTVAPEETLADSLGSYLKMEIPISGSVAQVFCFLIASILGFFLLYSFNLQVFQGKAFSEIAVSNRSAVYEIPSVRGLILDRNGEIVAGSQPVFSLMAVTADLPEEEVEQNNLTQVLAQILNEPEENIKSLFSKGKSQSVFFVKKGLTKEQSLQIQNRFENGVYVLNDAERWYPDGQKFSGVIGYTGKISQRDLLEDDYYSINDRKGRAGIEESYESYLRGGHGRVFFDRVNKKYLVNDPVAGNSLTLNIDGKVQKNLYDSLISILRENGLKAASAVAQNPNTGEILGLVSFPSFDNNLLVADLDESTYKKYFEGRDRPVFNRAVGGKYNPGSTIKPLLALAGLFEGVITPDTTITDLVGYITIPNIYNPEIVYKYRDWKVQGTLKLKKALAQSSDIYFYSVGGGYGDIKGLGFEKLEKYFRQFFIDKILGIDIGGETAGFVPNEEWKLEKAGQPWFTGDTYNVSIGQGDLLTTPLWLSSYVSAIANGGVFYKPFIVKKISEHGGGVVKEFSGEELGRLPFDTNTMQVVREGMREVVISGTAQLLNTLPFSVAAKTGTAEVGFKGGQLNSVFIAYEPYDNPEIAISIVIENIGNKQGLAVLAAKRFFENLLSPSN